MRGVVVVSATDTAFRRMNVETMYHPAKTKQVMITWDIRDDVCLRRPITYTLERARAYSAVDWEPVARTVDQLFIVDRAPEQLGVDFSLFYRVTLQDADGVTSVSQPASYFMNLDPYPWRLMRQYVRMQLLGQDRRGGVDAWLLKRLRSGDKCTACTNTANGQVLSTACESCYGTGFVGGYHPPLPYPVFATPDQRKTRLTEAGLSTTVLKSVVALAYAAPAPNDVLVYARTLTYYRIAGDIATAVEYGGVPVSYNLRVEQVPDTHKLTTVPVPRWET